MIKVEAGLGILWRLFDEKKWCVPNPTHFRGRKPKGHLIITFQLRRKVYQ